jgi:DnaK suppressor protein
MFESLTDHQIAVIRRRLEQRLAALGEVVREELLRADEEAYRELAGAVADPGDESTADLLADVNLAVISNHINEIRDVEAALMRIARGVYGECVGCEREIEVARLDVHPTALRCHDCQVRYESSPSQVRHATL